MFLNIAAYTLKLPAMQENELNQTLTTEQLENISSLLLLFPADELLSFYDEFSQQMLLTTTTQIERHEALQKLLQLLAKG